VRTQCALRHLRAGGEGHAAFVGAAAKLFSDEQADEEADDAATAALRKRCAPPTSRRLARCRVGGARRAAARRCATHTFLNFRARVCFLRALRSSAELQAVVEGVAGRRDTLLRAHPLDDGASRPPPCALAPPAARCVLSRATRAAKT
jgi:hypothetical protein